MNETRTQSLLALISSFSDLHEAEVELLPYHFNIMEELKVNENAHTRILMRLLQYSKRKNVYPILTSFIDMLFKTSEHNLKTENPTISINREFIDGLIEDRRGNYAIIVENKACDACDQPKQIERYINTVERHGISNKNIFVVYLTRGDGKYISEDSFTKSAKKILNYKSDEERGRYIPINYRDDIYPWLNNEIYPIEKEELISSAIYQYIDYLKDYLDIREENKDMNDKLNKLIEKETNINSEKTIDKFISLSSTLEDLEALQSRMVAMQNNYTQSIAEKSILPSIAKFAKENNLDIEHTRFSVDFINIILSNKMWEKCKLHFFTDSKGNGFGLEYNDPNKTISEKACKELLNILKDYEAYHNWPIWKYTKKNFLTLNPDFWQLADDGSFAKYMEKEFKHILETINKLGLKL